MHTSMLTMVMRKSNAITVAVMLCLALLWAVSFQGVATSRVEDKLNTITATNSGRDAWNEWFQPLMNGPHVGGAGDRTEPTGRHYAFLFYHVKKTGGTSLSELFLRLNNKYYQEISEEPALKRAWFESVFGREGTGEAEKMNKWRNQPNTWIEKKEEATTNNENNNKHVVAKYISNSTINKILLISFREPIERVISHYFQLKPCPDGRKGGNGRRVCRKSAQLGVQAFLNACKHSNLQSQYLDNDFKKLDYFDVILPNDRMDEALVLMSIKFQISIKDLFYVRKKTRVVAPAKNNTVEGKSCTAEWMNLLVPPERLVSLNCSQSCAGKMGRFAFSEQELNDLTSANERDSQLWNKHVMPRYESDKLSILNYYGVGQDDLNAVVSKYNQARRS